MHILVKYKLKGFFYIQIIFIFSILCGINPLFSQSDSLILKVHFLYGSKPAKHYKKTESKYFGGLHGGHVTIELENIDYGFSPSGKVHIFAHKKNYHGAFGFYDTQGKEPYTNEEKYAIVKIPISKNDAIKVKEIFEKYLELTPYDYAFFVCVVQLLLMMFYRKLACKKSAENLVMLSVLFIQKNCGNVFLN